MELDRHQVYNADESAAFWRVLPSTTWVHDKEKSAPGRKISKDRVTFMPCCNAAGSHKLELLVLGKAKNPRPFRNVHLPVLYEASTKGWMTQVLFMDWFKKQFIPKVKRFLKQANKPQKALLLVDNARSHPIESEINFDPNFKVLFLPPNCTAILQPMDQNLIQNIKVAYRKKLLNFIIDQNDDDIVKIFKKCNLKDAVTFLDQAWQSITEKNIQSSWSALWPPGDDDDDDEEESLPLVELRKRLRANIDEDLNQIKESLLAIAPTTQLTDEQIRIWAIGENENNDADATDEQIITEAVEKNKEEEEDEHDDEETENGEVSRIKHCDAIKAFSLCIKWAEENQLPLQDILLMKKVEENAQKKYLQAATQKKIDEFFKRN
jgi:hypothetical protein